MEIESPKCVLVVAEELPVGLAANVAAVLAITLGHRVESIVGPDAIDGSGQAHAGLIKITLPILKAQKESIKQIREKASAMPGLFVVDVTEPAQTERTYSNYLEKMTTLSAEQLGYLGVALYGSKKLVNKLTGNLPLLQ